LHIPSTSAFRQPQFHERLHPGNPPGLFVSKFPIHTRIHTTIWLIDSGLNIPHIALVLEPKSIQFRSKILQRVRYSGPSLGLRCLLKLRCLRISFAGSWLAFGHACVARRELVPRARGTSLHSCCEGQARDGKSREDEEPRPSRLPNLSLWWRSGHCYGCLNLMAVRSTVKQEDRAMAGLWGDGCSFVLS
jgi:hypothetical protein